MAGQMGSVGDSVWELVRPIHLLYLVDMPFLLVCRGRHRELRTTTTGPQPDRGHRRSSWRSQSRPCRSPSCSHAGRADGFAVARARGLGAYQVASLLRGARQPRVEAPARERRVRQAGKRPAQSCRRASSAPPCRRGGARMPGVDSGAYAGQERLRHPGRVATRPRVRRDHRGPGDHAQHQPHGRRQLGVLARVRADGRRQHRRCRVHREHVVCCRRRARPRPSPTPRRSSRRFRGCSARRATARFTMHANSARRSGTAWSSTPLWGSTRTTTATTSASEDRMWRGASDEAFFAQAQKLLLEEMSYGRPDLRPARDDVVARALQEPCRRSRRARPAAARDCATARPDSWVGALELHRHGGGAVPRLAAR